MITLDLGGVRNQALQSTAADAILIANVWACASDRCRSTLGHSGSLKSTATNTIYVTNLWTIFTLHLINDRFKATLLADGSRGAVFDTAIVDGADGADSAVQSWRTALGWGSKDACHGNVSIKCEYLVEVQKRAL